MILVYSDKGNRGWNTTENSRTIYDKGGKTMLKRKIPEQEIMQEHRKDGVLYFTFPLLDAQSDWIVHGFSSRIGGVSENELSSMNLSFGRGDSRENVMENYRRIAAAIGFDDKKLVCSHQTHTNHVRAVTEADCGKGYLRERDYQDVDGLVTNVPGVVLATYYADCVPLFFADPVHQAVGLSHSGWRGTVSDIAGETIRLMEKEYGSRPEQLLAAVGPSICQDCYEVSLDVIEEFRKNYQEELWPLLYRAKENGKFQLNLWEACRQNLLRAGVLPERIQITDLCTCCNPDILFSHRASNGRRGNLAGFLGIRG